ncbi:hypothetical protein PpBr36_00210 [Pyricularia pennisetigena]|uniref:hypothetical protein n=1 Tax=Pyricularia pennisetigena TaxID=1578925 RepID=UPI00114EA8D0|nr:hypothetical protein PpBr36_00210 [Pyricularia pennisetigena]TLS29452.1 hypothetical protein PpBr36_00210 [Pyricularia pennisetigena]
MRTIPGDTPLLGIISLHGSLGPRPGQGVTAAAAAAGHLGQQPRDAGLDDCAQPLPLGVDGDHDALQGQDDGVEQHQLELGGGGLLADEVDDDAAVQVAARGLAPLGQRPQQVHKHAEEVGDQDCCRVRPVRWHQHHELVRLWAEEEGLNRQADEEAEDGDTRFCGRPFSSARPSPTGGAGFHYRTGAKIALEPRR